MLDALGRRLARFLSREDQACSTSPPTSPELLKRVLRPGDVLLIEGTSIIAAAIKYLTQSTWAHAALYVGAMADPEMTHRFIEADLVAGVRIVGVEQFAKFHCRICRPVGLSQEDLNKVISHAMGRVGHVRRRITWDA